MTFTLVPAKGESLQVIDWLWGPTLELLLSENAITEEDHQRMGAQGCAAKVDTPKAVLIADVIAQKLVSAPKGRMLRDLSVTNASEPLAAFGPNVEVTYKWLRTFAQFCRSAGGFEVS